MYLLNKLSFISVFSVLSISFAHAQNADDNRIRFFAEGGAGVNFGHSYKNMVLEYDTVSGNYASSSEVTYGNIDFSPSFSGKVSVGASLNDNFYISGQVFKMFEADLDSSTTKYSSTSGASGSARGLDTSGDLMLYTANVGFDLPLSWRGIGVFGEAGAGVAQLKMDYYRGSSNPYRYTNIPEDLNGYAGTLTVGAWREVSNNLTARCGVGLTRAKLEGDRTTYNGSNTEESTLTTDLRTWNTTCGVRLSL